MGLDKDKSEGGAVVDQEFIMYVCRDFCELPQSSTQSCSKVKLLSFSINKSEKPKTKTAKRKMSRPLRQMVQRHNLLFLLPSHTTAGSYGEVSQ